MIKQFKYTVVSEGYNFFPSLTSQKFISYYTFCSSKSLLALVTVNFPKFIAWACAIVMYELLWLRQSYSANRTFSGRRQLMRWTSCLLRQAIRLKGSWKEFQSILCWCLKKFLEVVWLKEFISISNPKYDSIKTNYVIVSLWATIPSQSQLNVCNKFRVAACCLKNQHDKNDEKICWVGNWN